MTKSRRGIPGNRGIQGSQDTRGTLGNQGSPDSQDTSSRTSLGAGEGHALGFGLPARLAAEALGTFLLVFAGLGIALFNGAGNQTAVPVGFGFGVALIAAVIAFGHVSGGHFNPAVSVAAAIAGKIRWLRTLWYAIAQVVGGTVAALVLFAVLKIFPAVTSSNGQVTPQTLFSSLSNGFDAHSPSHIPLAGALLIELVGTAIFVAVVLGSTQLRANTGLAPFAIGLSYAAVITVALPLTNASINPARSTAVVFFAEPWAAGQLWLFWVAPLLGAVLAGLLYRAFAVPVPAAGPGLVPTGAEAGPEIVGFAGAAGVRADGAAVGIAETGWDTDDDDASDVGVANGQVAAADAEEVGQHDAGHGARRIKAGEVSGSQASATLPGTAPGSGAAGHSVENASPGTTEAQDFFDNPRPPK